MRPTKLVLSMVRSAFKRFDWTRQEPYMTFTYLSKHRHLTTLARIAFGESCACSPSKCCWPTETRVAARSLAPMHVTPRDVQPRVPLLLRTEGSGSRSELAAAIIPATPLLQESEPASLGRRGASCVTSERCAEPVKRSRAVVGGEASAISVHSSLLGLMNALSGKRRNRLSPGIRSAGAARSP